MTVFTTHEQQEIDRANAEGKQSVMFVHGLWLLASSRDNWRTLFEEQGYTTLAPGWPDDPQTVVEADDDPEVFANKRIKQVTDHYVDAIRQLKRKPAVIGHSFGGLISPTSVDRPGGDGEPSPGTYLLAHVSEPGSILTNRSR